MTAIFDMDGLLLDTEPLWGKSMLQVAHHYQIPISPDHFKYTTGLRIYEVTDYWSKKFPWPGTTNSKIIAEDILDDIIARSKKEAKVMDGALKALQFLKTKGVPIGLATSSPTRMMEELISFFHLKDYFKIMVSADTALIGKPHPEVYLQCAHSLHSDPWDCVAFEDSLNGMISAKAARMKVVVVPEAQKWNDPGFGLADVQLTSLTEFNAQVWKSLEDHLTI